MEAEGPEGEGEGAGTRGYVEEGGEAVEEGGEGFGFVGVGGVVVVGVDDGAEGCGQHAG